MPLLIPALLLAAAPTPGQTPAVPVCRDRPQRTRAPQRMAPHPLGEEPPARQIYTVLRSEDGCARPVLVNRRVIGAPSPRRDR